MALRKPIRIEVLAELHDRLAELRERAVALELQPHDVYEHAFFFGLPSAARMIERAELDAERARNATRLDGERPLGCSKGCLGRMCRDALNCDAVLDNAALSA